MASSLGNILARMENRLSSSGPASIGGGVKAAFLQCGDDKSKLEIECSDHTHCEVYHVLYHESMKTFAESMQTHGTPDKKFVLYNTYWDKFEDGTDNITLGATGRDSKKKATSMINKPTFFKGKDLLFIASFHSNDVTMSQFHVLAHLCESFAKSLTVILPFYSNATMERVDINDDGVVPTANTLARLFNGLPSMGYPVRLMTYDLHTLQNRFYLTGSTIASLHTATTLMKEAIRDMTSDPIDSLAFPDAGARKRFGKLFHPEIQEDKTIVCEKIRKGGSRIITIVEGKDLLSNGTIRHILIVDDMINSGTTLLECAEKLRAVHTDLKISVYVTHAIFNDTFFSSVQDNKFRIFNTVYTTDSIPNKIRETLTQYSRKDRTEIQIPREEKANINNTPLIHSFDDHKINIKILPLAKQVISDL
jgi:phosphoribosylpyrophosphate synthetase